MVVRMHLATELTKYLESDVVMRASRMEDIEKTNTYLKIGRKHACKPLGCMTNVVGGSTGHQGRERQRTGEAMWGKRKKGV
jgi:hypothetical protein